MSARTGGPTDAALCAVHPEVEDKYDVDGAARLPNLVGAAGVWAVDAATEQCLDATYFDTEDLALRARNVTLRQRTGGEHPGWHLKLPADGVRHEVRVPLRSGTTEVPQALRSTLWGLIGGRDLSPVVSLRTHRTVHRVRDRAGVLLAEVADDYVESQTCSGVDGPEPKQWREWEVELIADDARLLSVVGRLLEGNGAVASPWPSKLARALGEGRPDTVPVRSTVTRDSPASALAEAYLVQQLDRLLMWDPLVRCDAPDAVHQMRVTTRRLRAVLAAFRPLLNRERTDPLRDELGWLCVALGEARDAEVMLERLHRLVRSEGLATAQQEEVLARIDAELGRHHQAALARALHELESDRYRLLLDHLEELVADPPWTPRAGEPVRVVLRRRARREWKRLARAVAAVHAAHGPGDFDRKLHEARKAAKRVRYVAEPLVAVYGVDAARLVEAARQIQSALGAHQDSVVTQAHLRRLRSGATAAGGDAETFHRLETRERLLASQAADKFDSAWRAASKRKLRRWLR